MTSLFCIGMAGRLLPSWSAPSKRSALQSPTLPCPPGPPRKPTPVSITAACIPSTKKLPTHRTTVCHWTSWDYSNLSSKELHGTNIILQNSGMSRKVFANTAGCIMPAPLTQLGIAQLCNHKGRRPFNCFVRAFLVQFCPPPFGMGLPQPCPQTLN